MKQFYYKPLPKFTLVEGDVNSAIIPLTQNQVTIVDTIDAIWLSKFNWSALKTRNTYYAFKGITKSKGVYSTITMHKMIMNPPEGLEIDHIDHDGLNNRRKNLRVVTHLQNNANRLPRINGSSIYKGVSWDKNSRKWHARFDQIHLGYFEKEEDAALAYNNKAKEVYKEFACLN